MSEYRFYVNDDDGTIFRGRAYRVDDPDVWSYYWDGFGPAAFYDEGFRGLRLEDGTDKDAGERVINAWHNAKGEDRGAALKRVAERVSAEWGNPHPDRADFIEVSLDWGMSLFVLVFDATDEDWVRAYRREIEAVWHGDIYRIEVEEYVRGGGLVADQWLPADDICAEFYGEEQRDAGFENAFPLTEFPAELTI